MLTPGYGAVASVVALTGATAMTGTATVGWRINQRRRALAAATNVISHQLKAPVVIEKARWRGRPVGEVVEVTLRYTELAAIGYGELLPAQLVLACSKAFGRPFRTVHQTPAKSRIRLAAATVHPAADLTEAEKQQQRVRGVVSETFGSDAAVADVVTGQDHSITRFTVHYRSAAAKVTVAAIRRRITNAVGDRLDGRWKADFSLQNDTVTFTRRPPLPTYYPRPTDPIPARNDPAFNLLPQAVNEEGHVQHWDIAGISAHMLRCGRTRSGKTISLIGDAVEAARRGFRVLVLDPKRTEFLGLRNWPNVELVATRVPDQVALVHLLWLEMEDRYRRIEEEGAHETDFDPILFIIDEYRQLHANVKAWWSGIKVTGMPSECPVFEEIGSLLRMAAACRIHVDLATQRPDAEFLKGEALAVDTPIPTPTGWTTMGELQVGQQVLDEDGRPVRVAATTAVSIGRPCYRLTFSDGTSLVADEDHLWAAKDASRRAAIASPYRPMARHQRFPGHPFLERRLAELPSDDRPVLVSELERELGFGRVSLLRRRIHQGRWQLASFPSASDDSGRFAGRLYSRTALIESLLNELRSPVPTGRQHGPRIVPTKVIAGSVHVGEGHNWSIDTVSGLDLPEVELPIDPWLLGYWLGDGSRGAATIATADEEVLERIRRLGYRVTHYARYNYGVSTGPRGGWNRPSLQRSLRECGLLHNKHVPPIYLRASDAQRAELLAGLLDSDGTCSVRGRGRPRLSAQVSFTNTNPLLVEGVRELAASLGYIPTVRKVRPAGVEKVPSSVAFGRRTSAAWAVRFTPDRQVFGIRRKQEILERALVTGTTNGRRPRYVVRVEKVPTVPVRCITVDSPTHLYLAGRSFIPTHNCRDNFSARAAAGRLSPDGAQMMFDSQHIGVAIPANVRGRGTMIGVDDRPGEVQFLYTPDPRKARSPEDLALLEALRPVTTTWPRQAIQLPDVSEFAEELAEGKKTSLEWEQVLRGRFIPWKVDLEHPEPDFRAVADPDRGFVDDPSDRQDPTDDEYEPTDDGYQRPTVTHAGAVEVGDLITVQDGQAWVCVADVSELDDGYMQFRWRNDDDDTGDLLTSAEEILEVRKPANDE